jgi:hypothetical protein
MKVYNVAKISEAKLVHTVLHSLKSSYFFYPEDGSSILLQNLGVHPPNYTASHPRREYLKKHMMGRTFSTGDGNNKCSQNFSQKIYPNRPIPEVCITLK